jgi:general secretion pathway protein A
MSYYKVLGFENEPFSTSPDPEFFYLSKEHERALTNVLIQLRLKRGLSVILGDVGTGKTTLSRKLIQELNSRDDFIFHIILDPSFENATPYDDMSFSFAIDSLCFGDPSVQQSGWEHSSSSREH